MSPVEGPGLEAIVSRLTHDITALNRQVSLWSLWAAEDLAKGEDIQPLLAKITAHSERMGQLITLSKRLADLELQNCEPSSVRLEDQAVSAAKLVQQFEGTAFEVVGSMQVTADPILVLLTFRIVFEMIGAVAFCRVQLGGSEILIEAPKVEADNTLPIMMVYHVMEKQGGSVLGYEKLSDTFNLRLFFPGEMS